MFDRILFPTDGSEGARATTERVLDLAAAHGATVHAVFVLEVVAPQKSAAEVVREGVQNRAEEALAAVVAAGERRDIPVETSTLELEGSVSATVVEFAARAGADAIALPAHGRRGLHRYLLGSVTQRVVQRASVPVVTFPVPKDGETETERETDTNPETETEPERERDD